MKKALLTGSRLHAKANLAGSRYEQIAVGYFGCFAASLVREEPRLK
jgi:hypothetical protein